MGENFLPHPPHPPYNYELRITNCLMGLSCGIITQVRSHLRHNIAMASSMRYAIFKLH
jgi:hypothetical protein